ncbi:cytochrome c [Draconibacterium sp. IB214405]|uniref:c-type cytochrome n=1 Tax=Draconibacterium sp. IB214405 TaxID=3097352 RepID=UPI002A0BA675|nr:cytochrome c [Draconibacterium sp. IB214405]MDX8338379.1 cytochrome c [Draconibacterium sp. IB214405]
MKIKILFIALIFFAQQGMAQEWLVPEDQKNVQNPSEYNLANVKKGKDLYLQNCKSCHGDPGKGNGLPLVPPPPDIASDIMQAQTEGEMFYKITHGRGGMPQFETTLSEDDRWRLVNYIRNYNPANEPLIVEAPPKKAKILASVNETEKSVEVFAEFQDKDSNYVVLAETPIFIGAKKAFGTLPIGEILTNKEGRAEYKIPETLIGDEQGMVNIVVELGEGFITDQVVLDAAKVGQPKPTPKLIQREILWSTNENIQTWLLLSYLAAVLGAWGTIGYVVFQIFKIKRAGKEQ